MSYSLLNLRTAFCDVKLYHCHVEYVNILQTIANIKCRIIGTKSRTI